MADRKAVYYTVAEWHRDRIAVTCPPLPFSIDGSSLLERFTSFRASERDVVKSKLSRNPVTLHR